MPAVIPFIPLIAAGIAGGATVYAAKKQSDATKDATKAAAAGNTAALDFTKQQEAARRAEYEKATEAYQRQWEAWNGQRMALLQRYGVDVSGMQPRPPMSTTGGTPSLIGDGRTDPRSANVYGTAALQGQTVSDILSRGRQPDQWNDWSSQGLPSA